MATNRYKVVHMRVGPFPQDRVISRAHIEAAGGTPDHLLNIKAIVETDEPLTATPMEFNSHHNAENTEKLTSLDETDTNSSQKEESNDSSGKNDEVVDLDEEGSESAEVELASMKKSELLALAVEKGIEGADKLSKPQLIAAIQEQNQGE